MDPLPHAGLLPRDEPAPTDRPGPTAYLARQHVPRETAAEDEQDTGQDDTVGDRLAARVSAIPRRPRGRSGSIKAHRASSSNGLVMQ